MLAGPGDRPAVLRLAEKARLRPPPAARGRAHRKEGNRGVGLAGDTGSTRVRAGVGRGGSARLKLYLSMLWLSRNEDAAHYSYPAHQRALLMGLDDPERSVARRIQVPTGRDKYKGNAADERPALAPTGRAGPGGGGLLLWRVRWWLCTGCHRLAAGW